MKINEKSIYEKIYRYRKFWKREAVKRPRIGFDVGGFFPLRKFKSLRKVVQGIIHPEMITPTEHLNDYERFYHESTNIDDNLIKGVSPIPAIPWMESMLGCTIKISGESIWAEERKAKWDDLEDLSIEDNNAWLEKYLEFLEELVFHADGKYPVGQPLFQGITDLVGALRGHSHALIDCMEAPDQFRKLSRLCAEELIKVTQEQYRRIEPYRGGYFIEQFSLLSPDKIVRLQEDALTIYFPDLYRNLIQENDHLIASAFPLILIHLYSLSLFLINYFIEIEEIDVFQINRDAVGMTIEYMITYLKNIQNNRRYLLIRGNLTGDDLKMVEENLSQAGLLLQIVVNSPDEANKLKEEFPWKFQQKH